MYSGNLHKFQSILSGKQRLHPQAAPSFPTRRQSPQSNGILQGAIEEIRRRLPVESCQFLWHHPDRRLSVFDPGCQSCSFERICSGCITPKTVSGERFGQIFVSQWSRATDSGRDGLLSVALKTRSGERGVFVCGRGQHQPMWGHEEVALLRVMAHRLMLAMERICQAAP
ncbi:hypothetical protein [Oscillatoria sp. FACHB-1406]|uniref:hypothetical protein n=1 Tax=Oscillatoria sp. FACHB-1406 TaxID=2692846 RepID=UPI001684F345|nr:hypothetical protein [Oscillatoria sp. FACHB-1406]MBD2577778.1 hypothetical protein [Oscillatoria sp. FACHB-1406]